jgi:hypothetical protein
MWQILVVVLALTAVTGGALAADDAAADAKLNAKQVLVSARLVYMKGRSYQGVTAKSLKAKNPEFDFSEDGPSTRPGLLSIEVIGPGVFRIAVYGGGTCWGVREEGTRGGGVATLYAKRVGPSEQCKATSFRDDEFREHAQAWGR